MSLQGRFNIYTCPAGHRTVTLDVDEGVTPMFLACRSDRAGGMACTEMAESACYPDGPLPDSVRQLFDQSGFEWYRPSLKWARRQGPEMLEHVQRGGLVLRRHEKEQQHS